MRTANECLMANDLDTAFERYQKTNARWKNYWYEVCETIFYRSKTWRNKYIISPVMKHIYKRGKINYNEHIIWNCEKPVFEKGAEQFYAIRLVDKNFNLIYSKCGTTTRTIDARMKEHLRYYIKDDVENIIIDFVMDCEKIPAEALESFFRAYGIKRNPKAFKKNDRFRGIEFSMEEIYKIIAKYKELQGVKKIPSFFPKEVDKMKRLCYSIIKKRKER